MQLKTLFLAGFVAAAAVASEVDTNLRSFCGASVPTEEHLMKANAILQQRTPFNNEKRAATINVIVHVVSVDDTYGGGNVPDGQILNQISVINREFSRYGFNFGLAGITRTINARWSRNLDEGQMKGLLRRGGPADLNLYITSDVILGGSPVEGKSTFPWEFNQNPRDDGVVLAFRALPGGPGAYNTGLIAVHEIGHWLGLLHTFQNGCSSPGDYVDDTPFQASGYGGCAEGRDTCAQPGADPVHNHMSYSDDPCRREFTNGQVTRMIQAAGQFRGIQL